MCLIETYDIFPQGKLLCHYEGPIKSGMIEIEWGASYSRQL
jgi:hypothetical protein